MKRTLFLSAAACLACGSSRAAIGTPVNIGQGQVSSTSLILTTTTDSPVGNLNVVAIQTHGATVSSVVDQVGNSYALCSGPYLVASERVYLYGAVITADLPAADTITINLGGAQKINAAAATVSGVRTASPCDSAGQGTATGTGTAVAGPTTGTLTGSPEIIFGLTEAESATSGETYTQPSGWTALTKSGSAGTSAYLEWGYQVVSSTAPVNYSPTLGTSRTWVSITGSFFDASVLGGSGGSRVGLTGVGH